MKALALTALLVSPAALADTSVGGPSRVQACYAPAALARAIHCKGLRCSIDGRAIDCWLEHSDELARSARIVPSIHDGQPTGFKLYAVRPGSLFERLQIRNGDEIRTINGMDLSSPEKALEVYSRMRAATQFDVALQRAGAALTMHYSITEQRIR